jgi:uncharacterized membrane protein YccC
MPTVGSIVIVVVAAVLLVTAVLLVRSPGLPWPAIVVAALTSAVCFTVGGDPAQDAAGPSIATVTGSVAGVVSVVAAIMALVPKRSHENPASRTPIVLSAGGVVIGALGLLVTVLIG